VAQLNPAIMVWARETAGLDLETAARKISLNAARGVSGADRLAALEAGDGSPSLAVLRKMSQQYHRPLLTFYMAEPPVAAELGQDFRTLLDQGNPSNVLLATLLRDVKARQALVREALEDDDDAKPVALVGAAWKIKDATVLSAELVKAINFDRAVFRSRKSVDEAFAYLRGLIEAKGVFVLLAGDCGNHMTAIDVNVFRGFAIADAMAPFIVVNDQDAKSAWSFTLLHELAHILIGQGGVSGGVPQGAVERLCNDTAAATLIASTEIDDLPLTGTDSDKRQIATLADQAKVSRTMIAYQLFRADRIDHDDWVIYRDQFRSEWMANKARIKEANRGSDGGPNWYVVRRHRLGTALLAVARQGMADGSLTPTRAARMLGVKPMNVYPLLAETRRAVA
jgi:Zn-dependent peptidase ImmA (M78 family)/transcriptional regulator with XRE-family HTH domain